MTAPVTVPAAAPLSNLAGVELIHTGQWHISTGTWTATTDDIAAAVGALDCPAVRRPVLKLGHVDPRFDGEPAVGWVDNLAATAGGHTLVGDYVGMPGWLGPVLASAYPDRSIEGVHDFVCQAGHVHPFVVEAVALLGVTPPGIGTLASLQDVAQLYGVAAAADPARGVPITVTVRAATGAPQGGPMPNPRAAEVAAGVTTEDVRRAYYDDAPWSMWIREFHLDPLQLIVDDDSTGRLARVPVIIGDGDGEDAVTFGEAVPVVVRYEDAPTVAAAGAAGPRAVLRYASRAESRPGQRRAGTDPSSDPPAPPVPTPTPERSTPVELTDEQAQQLRQQYGLPDDADAAALVTAITMQPTPTNPPTPAPAPSVLPDGVVTIDAAALTELRRNAAAGAEARERQQREDRERTVDAAVRDGRIPPARRDHWVQQLTADPGAESVLASLAPGTVPLAPAGYAADPADASANGLYERLFGQGG